MKKYFGIQPFGVLFSFGHAGVHFFFILSGFIIFHVHQKDLGRPGRLLNYLRKRTTRIYPIYWIIFTAVLGLALAVPILRTSVPHDFATIVESLLLLPQKSTLIGGTGAPVLIVAWSLQYEMIFYMCFAVAILNRWLGCFLMAAILLTYILPISDLPFPGSLFQTRWPLLFLLGVGIAFVIRFEGGSLWPGIAAMIGGLSFLTFAAIEVIYGLAPPVRDFGYGISGALTVWGMVKLEDHGVVIGGNPFIQLLGAASYVLFLIHYPLISVLTKLMMVFVHRDLFSAIVAYLVISIACVVAAIAVHRLVELPIARLLRSSPRAAS